MKIGYTLANVTRAVSSSPSLVLSFADTSSLDPRVTFTRASSATRVNASGLIESVAANAPRFDYDPVTKAARGFLVEEQRTNLLVWSAEFDNAVWGNNALVVTPNSTAAPDGTTTADLIVPNTTSANHRLTQNFNTTTVGTYTGSVWVKAAGYNFVRFRVDDGGNAADYTYNITTGAVSNSSGAGLATSFSAMPYPNGWVRLTATVTFTAATFTIVRHFVEARNDGGIAPITGDGTSGIYIWGAQLEVGAFPTSYIPTTTAQVTRAADSAVISGTNFSQFYNQSEGTVYAEFSHSRPAGFPAVASFNNASATERVNLIASTSTGFRGAVQSGGVSQADIGEINYTLGTVSKIVLSAKANDFAFCANGRTPLFDTSGVMPVVNQLELGRQSGGLDILNGHIRAIRYYPRRLSNAELQALTA